MVSGAAQTKPIMWYLTCRKKIDFILQSMRKKELKGVNDRSSGEELLTQDLLNKKTFTILTGVWAASPLEMESRLNRESSAL